MSSRPVLAGSIQRKRKSEKKATKFDSTQFRNDLLTTVQGITEDAEIFTALEGACDNLDFKRYAEPLFEILFLGGILGIGGVLELGEFPFPNNFFSGDGKIPTLKRQIDIIIKLVRSKKYLIVNIEETIAKILQNAKKFTSEQVDKIGTALGLLASCSLVPMTTFNGLSKEYLVKEGLSLQIITEAFRSYLSEQTPEHLSNALRRSGLDVKLMEFFPQSKQTPEYFIKYFETEDLKAIIDIFNKKQLSSLKDNFMEELGGMIMEDRPVDEVLKFVKEQSVNDQLGTESELVRLLWEVILRSIDWGKQEQAETLAIRKINQWSKLLAGFCASSKSEISLLCKIQVYCYGMFFSYRLPDSIENTKLMKSFKTIIALLYKNNVLSEGAILYWAQKGAVPQGKNAFLKQMEPFLEWLKQEEESDEEED